MLDENRNNYLDEVKDVTAESAGRTGARLITEYLEEHAESISADARFLGLGAGYAVPELAMASTLGITAENVTLVDKDYSKEHTPSAVTYEVMDMFDYLNSHPNSFDVVSAFGIEYVLARKHAVPAFVQLVTKSLKHGGFVCICGYYAEDLPAQLNAGGFTSLTFHPGFHIYRKGV